MADKGRTFLVTGATKGIGRALTTQLLARGHQVVGIARSPDPTFPARLYNVDVAHRDALAGVLADINANHQIDGVVNNAALVKFSRLGEIDLADVDAMFNVDVIPAIQVVQAVLPGMQARKWGRIVNLSSIVVLGIPERSGYAVAKAALISLTRTWAVELGPHGIAVNAIAPGPTETESFRKVTPVDSPIDKLYRAGVPMKRFATPEEVAGVIKFFLSEEAGYITGQTLFVDGGLSIGKAAF